MNFKELMAMKAGLQKELGEDEPETKLQQAKKLLGEILKTYPKSQAAKQARTMLGIQVEDDDSASVNKEAAAIAAIKKLGGRVTFRNNAVEVSLNGPTDDSLMHLKGLTSHKTVVLNLSNVTDAGLEHLKGMTNLVLLSLNGTNVTDAGLEHLKGLTKLQVLHLSNTNVTDEGVKKLQTVLPDCYIRH